MNPTATQYARADRALHALLDRVPAPAWTSPSPCAGWTARDVVRHLIDTQRELLTSHGADLGEAPDVDTDPAGAWRQHAERVAEVLGDDGFVTAEFDGFFGHTTVGDTLTRFYVWDMLVHRFDVARAAGVDAAFDDAELDLIEQGAAGFGPALYMEGICRPAVETPEEATRTVRVLARLGRLA